MLTSPTALSIASDTKSYSSLRDIGLQDDGRHRQTVFASGLWAKPRQYSCGCNEGFHEVLLDLKRFAGVLLGFDDQDEPKFAH